MPVQSHSSFFFCGKQNVQAAFFQTMKVSVSVNARNRINLNTYLNDGFFVIFMNIQKM